MQRYRDQLPKDYNKHHSPSSIRFITNSPNITSIIQNELFDMQIPFNIYIFYAFCLGTITTHAESINSDLQRGPDTRLRHTTLNTEQNQ